MAPETPVTLLSGGVGQTPMLAMLDTLAKAQHPAQVNWFHAAENGEVHAFAEEVKALGETLPKFTSHVWYRSPSEADRDAGAFDSEGLMDLTAPPTRSATRRCSSISAARWRLCSLPRSSW